MDTTEACTRGINNGRAAVWHCEIEHRLERKGVTLDGLDVAELREIIVEQAHEAEIHSRQYVGHFVYDLNRQIADYVDWGEGNAIDETEARMETLIEAYEDGVSIGVKREAIKRARSLLQVDSITA